MCWQERAYGADNVRHYGTELIGKGMEAWSTLEMGADKRSKGIRGLSEVVKAVDI